MNRKRLKQTAKSGINQHVAQQLQVALHLIQSNQTENATVIFQRLLKDYPRDPAVHFYYGNLLWASNQPQLAAKHYKIAVENRANFTDALGNLGAALWVLGKQDEAIKYYRKVIKLNPRNAEAHYNLAGAYCQQGKGGEAVSAFRSAIRIKPDYVDAYKNLGNMYYEQGRYPEAMECYKNVSILAPSGGAKVRLAAAIPMIPESMEDLHAIRDRLHEGLDRLLSEGLQIDDPIQENGYTNFFLAYHGEDDRSIQEKYAQLYLQSCPSLSYIAKHCRKYKPPAKGEKIKVGFISKFLMNHSIGNTSKGIIAKLSRKLFEVTTIFLSPPQDETGLFIQHHSDHTAVLPNNLAAAREVLASLELDILFHQDTGMDPFTFFLSFSRLAPIQCTSFGHPVTTGIPNLDYYISTELWEPEGADEHYSEKLARLRNVSSVAYYYKPVLESRIKDRRDFALQDRDHLYFCPQTLFKFHPEFDEILGGILRADPLGRIILIEGKHPYWAEILRKRFKQSLPDVEKRIMFMPRQSGKDFVNLIKVCDVMLDTIHFCGFNTTLQGFSVGTPVVTLPGKYMRSRHTLAFYRKMDYLDLVADSVDDFIKIAVTLGTDPGARQRASDEVSKRSAILWQEDEVIYEFERFFIHAVDQLRVEQQESIA